MKCSIASVALAALAAAAPVEIEPRQASGDTGCQPVAVFFARGTGEPGTNGAIVGPSLEKNLNTAFGNKITYTAIPYSAGISGDIPGGQGPGTSAYVSAINSQLQKCPSAKVVLTGYSQGAILVHSAAKSYGKPIAAAVTFGDPEKKATPQGCSTADYKTFCASGDPVCGEGADIAAHLSYGDDTAQAAQFIHGAVGGAATGGAATGASSSPASTTSSAAGGLGGLLGGGSAAGSAPSTAASGSSGLGSLLGGGASGSSGSSGLGSLTGSAGSASSSGLSGIRV